MGSNPIPTATKLNQMKKLFFDIETTGVMYWKNGIHQISGCIEIDGQVKEYFNLKVQPNPACKIEPTALEVGNVTLEQVQAYPPMNEVYRQFTAMLAKYCDKFNSKDKFFLVGYNNAAFDNHFLRAWFTQNGDKYFGSWFWANTIDVMVLATEYMIDGRHTLENFQLKTVCRQFFPVDEDRLHDAEYDIELTRDLYREVTKRYYDV